MTTTIKRNDYPDLTKSQRARRRYALQDAAARRMGYETWQKFGTAIRNAAENTTTNDELITALSALLDQAKQHLTAAPADDQPAEDILQALAAHPPKKRGAK